MLKLIGGTLAALLLATSGNDQDKHRKPASSGPAIPLTFKGLDHDGDGKVTREEFLNAFEALDRNHDGVLTADELSPAAPHDSKAKHGKSGKPGKVKRKQ